MKAPKSLRLTLSLLFIVLCALWGASETLHKISEYHGAALRGNDADTHYLADGWDAAPHLRDTLRWWVGSWGATARPFYRPLASLFFWTQYHLFGPNGKFEFTAMLLLWHFAALLVLWRFLCELLGEWPGTLSAGVWAARMLRIFEMPTPLGALREWKDIVESWHAAPYVVCLWCFLRFLRGEQSRYKWLALLWFWVALLVKEMAYTVPFMVLLLAWHEGKLRDRWRDAAPFFALAAAMVTFRFWALQGAGFRMGSNTQWPMRFLSDMGGGPFVRLLHSDFLTLVAVCGALALWQALERRWWHATASLAAVSVQIAVTAHYADMTFGEVASRLLVSDEWPGVFYLAALLFLWWRCLRRKNKHQVFGALWAVIVYLPLLSGPNTSHIFYFVGVGWAIWFAYGLLDVAEQARGATLRPHSALRTRHSALE